MEKKKWKLKSMSFVREDNVIHTAAWHRATQQNKGHIFRDNFLVQIHPWNCVYIPKYHRVTPFFLWIYIYKDMSRWIPSLSLYIFIQFICKFVCSTILYFYLCIYILFYFLFFCILVLFFCFFFFCSLLFVNKTLLKLWSLLEYRRVDIV